MGTRFMGIERWMMGGCMYDCSWMEPPWERISTKNLDPTGEILRQTIREGTLLTAKFNELSAPQLQFPRRRIQGGVVPFSTKVLRRIIAKEEPKIVQIKSKKFVELTLQTPPLTFDPIAVSRAQTICRRYISQRPRYISLPLELPTEIAATSLESLDETLGDELDVESISDDEMDIASPPSTQALKIIIRPSVLHAKDAVVGNPSPPVPVIKVRGHRSSSAGQRWLSPPSSPSTTKAPKSSKVRHASKSSTSGSEREGRPSKRTLPLLSLPDAEEYAQGAKVGQHKTTKDVVEQRSPLLGQSTHQGQTAHIGAIGQTSYSGYGGHTGHHGCHPGCGHGSWPSLAPPPRQMPHPPMSYSTAGSLGSVRGYSNNPINWVPIAPPTHHYRQGGVALPQFQCRQPHPGAQFPNYHQYVQQQGQFQQRGLFPGPHPLANPLALNPMSLTSHRQYAAVYIPNRR